MTRPMRFLMLGGFLGAGKTTTIARLAGQLIAEGRKVGLVTNDQAHDLVDTNSLRAQGFDVGEVAGACFCCKFDDLVDAVAGLAERSRPDVIIAEPVGSCTDLVATVIEPLRQLYGGAYDIAPFAVLLKPEHGQKILSGADDVGFSAKAAYIFLKQLEEADVVVLNKIDKLSESQRSELLGQIQDRFPSKEILSVSAKTGEGFEQLVDALHRPAPARRSTPEIDYDIYAEGEAELGWLNSTARLRPNSANKNSADFDVDQLLVACVTRLRDALLLAAAETAHLKVFAEIDGRMAVANLVGSGAEVELSKASEIRADELELIINARVAVDPDVLAELVETELAAFARELGLVHETTAVRSFRPGRPVPTHRMTISP